MTTFSKQHQLQKQSGLTKKQWSALLSHAASAVARCVKEKKISLENAKSKVMIAAIHDMYKVYYKNQFTGWVTDWYPHLLDMIRLLKQKAIDKEILAKERMLGEKEIKIFNRLEARGDPDKKKHNKEIYDPYLSRLVNRGANMDKNKYRLPEMIKPNYITQADGKSTGGVISI
jgi:hypothetical protein